MNTGVEVPPDAPSPSLLARFVAVFVNPPGLAVALRQRPAILGAIVLSLLVTVVAGVMTVPTAVDMMIDGFYDNMDPGDADEIAGTIEDNERVVSILLVASGPFTTLLSLLGWSVLLYAMTAAILSGRDPDLGFQHILSLVAHANLVNIPNYLLSGMLTRAQGEMVASLSLATLLGLSANSPAGVMAAWLSPFNLWWIWVLGVGLAVFYRLPISRAVLFPLVLSMMLRLLQVAMAGLSAPDVAAPSRSVRTRRRR